MHSEKGPQKLPAGAATCKRCVVLSSTGGGEPGIEPLGLVFGLILRGTERGREKFSLRIFHLSHEGRCGVLLV